MRLWLVLLLVALPSLLLPAPPAAAGQGWRSVRPGLEYRVAPLGPAPLQVMHQLRADPGRFRLGLALASDRGSKALPVGELRRAAGALAALNASYFDPEGKPLGYLRDGPRLIVPGVATGATLTGVLVVRPEGARILHRGSFQPGRALLALQAGPRLVAGGKGVQGLEGQDRRRRTGVGLDRRGRYLLYATDLLGQLTMPQCRDLLMGPPPKGGIEPVDVLNLDGGSSTGISLSAGSLRIESPALTPVPVALTVLER